MNDDQIWAMMVILLHSTAATIREAREGLSWDNPPEGFRKELAGLQTEIDHIAPFCESEGYP